jgi:hypothetical protein
MTTPRTAGDRLPDDAATELAIALLLADLDEPAACDTQDNPAPAGSDPTRLGLLAAARRRAVDADLPAAGDLPEAARPYAAQVAALAAVLAEPEVALVPRVVHGWDVVQTLGHLLAVDALAAASFGIDGPPETGTGGEVAERTEAVHAYFRGAGLDDVVRAWRAQAVALLRHAQAGGEARTAQGVTYLGLPLTVGDVLLDRAFEAWVHAEDLREASGLPSAAPAPEHVRLITGLGIRFLPFTLAPDAAPVLLELTGPGGGSWVVSPAGTGVAGEAGLEARLGVPSTRLALDAVEFCHVAGGRRASLPVPHDVVGDRHAAEGVLVAAAALARL